MKLLGTLYTHSAWRANAKKRWHFWWPMSLIRAGHGLRLKAVTSVFSHLDDYVRAHARVRVCVPKKSSTFTTQARRVIISELKFSSLELTNAFSLNRFLFGLHNSLSSAVATCSLKTKVSSGTDDVCNKQIYWNIENVLIHSTSCLVNWQTNVAHSSSGWTGSQHNLTMNIL